MLSRNSIIFVLKEYKQLAFFKVLKTFSIWLIFIIWHHHPVVLNDRCEYNQVCINWVLQKSSVKYMIAYSWVWGRDPKGVHWLEYS